MKRQFDTTEAVGAMNVAPSGHPVLLVGVGTSSIEIVQRVYLESQHEGGQVPFKAMIVDTLSYEGARAAMEQRGFSGGVFDKAIQPEAFFQLSNPFEKDFDFHHALNREYLEYLHEPPLQILARDGNDHGGRGTRAVAASYAAHWHQDLVGFFGRGVRDLTAIRMENLRLSAGTKVIIVTTDWGGTGGGTKMLVGAAIRKALPETGANTMTLIVGMPDIIQGDRRAVAQSYAGMQEIRHYDSYGKKVPVLGEDEVRVAFDSVIPVFAHNESGNWSLGPKDFTDLVVRYVLAETNIESQAAMDTKIVDLTDIVPYDLDGHPQNVTQTMAMVIRKGDPVVVEYIGGSVLKTALDKQRQHLEAWSADAEAENIAEARNGAERIIKSLGCDRDSLLALLEGKRLPRSMKEFLETSNRQVGSLRHQDIKQGIPRALQQLKERQGQEQRSRRKKCAEYMEGLLQAVLTAAENAYPDNIPKMLGVMRMVPVILGETGKSFEGDIKGLNERRQVAASEESQALSNVMQAKGVFGLFNNDEVTRDAARQCLATCERAAGVRNAQDACEVLATALDPQGEVGKAIEAKILERQHAVSHYYKAQAKELSEYLQFCGEHINRRSALFNRWVEFNELSVQDLDQEARRAFSRYGEMAEVKEFLRGKRPIENAVDALKPLLSRLQWDQPLAEMLESDRMVFEVVCATLRSASPFMPLDRTVEAQQGLRHRRDQVLILGVPGGEHGTVAKRLRENGAYDPAITRVIASSNDEIRYWFKRIGLSYGAVKKLTNGMRTQFEQYLKNPSAISPYTRAETRSLSPIVPPKSNMTQHTGEVITAYRACYPDRLEFLASGSVHLRYREWVSSNLKTDAKREFPDFSALQRWLAKEMEVRKELESALNSKLDNDRKGYVDTLVGAYRDMEEGKERGHLREALYRLDVDPEKRADP